MNKLFYRLALSFGCVVGFLLFIESCSESAIKSSQKIAQDTIMIETKKGKYSHPKTPYLLQKPSKNRLYQCKIDSDKKIYTQNDKILLDVSITNNSEKKVNFIGSIDGSDTKIKLPFCLFVVQKENQVPDHHGFIGCGNVLRLKSSDFIEIGINESFSPFIEGKMYSAFGEIIGNKIALNSYFFDGTGNYKIQFIYSTLSNNINDFLGYHLDSYSPEEVAALELELKKVPKLELYSNVLEIELK